jgi:hypothetical protein
MRASEATLHLRWPLSAYVGLGGCAPDLNLPRYQNRVRRLFRSVSNSLIVHNNSQFFK